MITNQQRVIWDPFVRFCHWTLVLCFYGAYVTGEVKGGLHRYAGYAVLTLIAARLVWGLIGSENARFTAFLRSPVQAVVYIKELVVGTPKYYAGHNPAAAWMIVLLLAGSLVVSLSGYMAYTAKKQDQATERTSTFSMVQSAYADDDGDDVSENLDRGHGHRKGNRRQTAEEDSGWDDLHEVTAQLVLLLSLSI